MFCPRCGASLPNDSAFCSSCGAQVSAQTGTAQPGTAQPGEQSQSMGEQAGGKNYSAEDIQRAASSMAQDAAGKGAAAAAEALHQMNNLSDRIQRSEFLAKHKLNSVTLVLGLIGAALLMVSILLPFITVDYFLGSYTINYFGFNDFVRGPGDGFFFMLLGITILVLILKKLHLIAGFFAVGTWLLGFIARRVFTWRIRAFSGGLDLDDLYKLRIGYHLMGIALFMLLIFGATVLYKHYIQERSL